MCKCEVVMLVVLVVDDGGGKSGVGDDDCRGVADDEGDCTGVRW